MSNRHQGITARLNAWALGHGTSTYNRLVRDRKRRLFEDLSGNVLEIGAGTGANLPFYPADVQLTVLDPNPHMHAYFERKADKYQTPYRHRIGKAENMQFQSETFDHVVSTLVLCSVDDLPNSLRQIYRVLKPGGSFRFIEHVAAPKSTWLRFLQRGIHPLWKCMAEGCHTDRDTWKDIQGAGFNRVEIEHFRVRLPIVSPHVMGWAEKA
jgi:ubiquinone/menaquinone biosynthesis C-methylase UbiE